MEKTEQLLTLQKVGEKTLRYVKTLPKQSFYGKLIITFEAGKEHSLKCESDTLAKNVV